MARAHTFKECRADAGFAPSCTRCVSLANHARGCCAAGDSAGTVRASRTVPPLLCATSSSNKLSQCRQDEPNIRIGCGSTSTGESGIPHSIPSSTPFILSMSLRWPKSRDSNAERDVYVSSQVNCTNPTKWELANPCLELRLMCHRRPRSLHRVSMTIVKPNLKRVRKGGADQVSRSCVMVWSCRKT